MTVDEPGSDAGGALPLQGLLVLDFSQFLAGPGAALRLADLGARVIKVERPGGGDSSRQLYMANLECDGDSVVFHAINRHKESVALDLKSSEDLELTRKLISRADVMIESFRPGIMGRLGLDYESVRTLNPRIVYASVTGYGASQHWRGKPGQDLLIQSMSGLLWTNGSRDQPPMPVGQAIADTLAGNHLVQGILACLVRRGVTGEGGRVEVSLLESIFDLMMETFTTFLNDNRTPPQRGPRYSAHAYLSAPYGVYPTADGYLALAMNPVARLGELLDIPELLQYENRSSWFDHRDEITAALAERLKTDTTHHWLAVLEPQDIWCAEVMTWSRLVEHPGFQELDLLQSVSRGDHTSLETIRCPFRIDGQVLKSAVAAPRLGQDNEWVFEELERGKVDVGAAAKGKASFQQP